MSRQARFQRPPLSLRGPGAKATKTRWRGLSGLLLALALLGAPAAIARDEANFGVRSLQPGFSTEAGTLSGHTGGSYSLAAISNRDTEGVACLGYGDSRPDHILNLEADFPQLTLQVDSQGEDTALLLEGPDGVRCGEDASAANLDDRIELKDLRSGRYSVWVGTMEPRNRQNYRLLLSEE